MSVCWQVVLATAIGMSGISFGWSVFGWCSGNLSLWFFLQPGTASGLNTETQNSIKFMDDSALLLQVIMIGSKEHLLGDLFIFSVSWLAPTFLLSQAPMTGANLGSCLPLVLRRYGTT